MGVPIGAARIIVRDDINSVVEASKSEAGELVRVRAPLPAPLDQL